MTRTAHVFIEALHRRVVAKLAEPERAARPRQANQALPAARAPAEHGFSDLKHWRILTRLRTDPGKATILLPPGSSSPASTPPADR